MWLASATLLLAAIVMATFSSEVSAATGSARGLLAAWQSQSRVDIVQETSSRISYRGTWKKTSYTRYLGGNARWTNATGASAGLSFTGSAVAWVGPIGPTRGKAKVYIDGILVTTVNSRADSFSPARVLFRKSWANVGTHRIKIVALGTPGHPTVALDAFLVRRDAATASITTTGTSVRVSSIAALLTALNDNSVTDIVVANGTYRVSPAGAQQSGSLWIGARFADRSRPVTVRAETRGGVTFDGGGASSFGCISFADGAHDQAWDGFRCAGGRASDTGAIQFGGYAGHAAPHHITMRHWAVDATVTGRATTADGNATDHAVYISKAVGGPHDLVFEDLVVDGRGGLASAFHFYHSDSANRNAWNVTIRRLTVTGTQQAIMLWDPTLHDIRIDGATITNALSVAVRHEASGATGIVYANITSTGSGSGTGFYSSLGAAPAGVTFIDNSFR